MRSASPQLQGRVGTRQQAPIRDEQKILMVRVPPELHRRVAVRCIEEGESMKRFVVRALTVALGLAKDGR